MGEIRKYNCKCGYEETLMVGAGMMGQSFYMIESIFGEEGTRLVSNIKAGSIQSFMLSNGVILCPSCHKLKTVPVVTYTDSNGEHQLKKSCDECGTSALPIPDEDNLCCPRCGKFLTFTEIGDWD